MTHSHHIKARLHGHFLCAYFLLLLDANKQLDVSDYIALHEQTYGVVFEYTQSHPAR